MTVSLQNVSDAKIESFAAQLDPVAKASAFGSFDSAAIQEALKALRAGGKDLTLNNMTAALAAKLFPDNARSAGNLATALNRVFGSKFDEAAQTLTPTAADRMASVVQQAMASGDFATAIMAIQEQRVSLLNEVIQQNIMSMDANNQKIKDARDRLIAKRNELKNTPDNKDNKDKREDLELDIANIQAEIDNLSTNSQSDTIKLQGLINKQNQALEMWTNLVQKLSDVMNKIVGNLR